MRYSHILLLIAILILGTQLTGCVSQQSLLNSQVIEITIDYWGDIC